MASQLSSYFDFKVITSGFDLHTEQPYSQVKLDQWNLVNVGGDSEILVWYNSVAKITLKKISKLIDGANADIVFVNGLFTEWSFFTLWLFRWRKPNNMRLILSPRGMLQRSALQSSALKKKIYLATCKFFRLFSGVEWHATNLDEQQDIINYIENARVLVADNIPKRPLLSIKIPLKFAGELRLVYLSLIVEQKNLLLLLESLSKINQKVLLDIYGPVKDEVYWLNCMEALKTLPSNICAVYKGEVDPNKVQSILEEYHALISLTKGENFGHALFESLSVGRPIITSNFTPWKNLKRKQAGWNIDISNIDNIIQTINEITQAEQPDWELLCLGAWNLSKSFYEDLSLRTNYLKLFS
jgi:glycosyltransferase involved in cell wall biosynthesis